MKNRISEKLTAKERKVIQDLFESGLTQEAVLAKHKVKYEKFVLWMNREDFASEFLSRMRQSRRQANMIIANFAPAAAARLIELSQSGSGETCRKACLDILDRPEPVDPKANPAELQTDVTQLPDATAGKILTLLADARKPKSEK